MSTRFYWTGRHWRPAAVRRRKLEYLPLSEALKLCTTEADLRELAAIRGFRPGWVWHRLREQHTAGATSSPARRRRVAGDNVPPWNE